MVNAQSIIFDYFCLPNSNRRSKWTGCAVIAMRVFAGFLQPSVAFVAVKGVISRIVFIFGPAERTSAMPKSNRFCFLIICCQIVHDALIVIAGDLYSLYGDHALGDGYMNRRVFALKFQIIRLRSDQSYEGSRCLSAAGSKSYGISDQRITGFAAMHDKAARSITNCVLRVGAGIFACVPHLTLCCKHRTLCV